MKRGVVRVAVVDETDIRIRGAFDVIRYGMLGALDTVGKNQADESKAEGSGDDSGKHCGLGWKSAVVSYLYASLWFFT